jgi:hypothetical protein
MNILFHGIKNILEIPGGTQVPKTSGPALQKLIYEVSPDIMFYFD